MPDVKSTNIPTDVTRTLEKAATDTMAAARGASEYVAGQTKNAVAAVNDGMQSATSYLGTQAQSATDAVSGGLKATAASLRQNAPQEGQFKDAVSNVAQTFSNTAGYLDREGFEGITNDLSTMIKKNPLPSFIVGIGLGFLLSRVSSSKA